MHLKLRSTKKKQFQAIMRILGNTKVTKNKSKTPMTTTPVLVEKKVDLRRLLGSTATGITNKMLDHLSKNWQHNTKRSTSQSRSLLMPFLTKTNSPRKRKNYPISCNNSETVIHVTNTKIRRTQSTSRTKVTTQIP